MRRFWWIIVALVLAESTCAFETTMIFVALSELYEIYGDPAHVGWMMTAFSLTAAATAAVSSRLGDIFGRRKVMLIMLCFAAVGSAISAVATDLNVIIAGRALQGTSMAVLPLAYGLLRENSPARQIPVGVGLLGGVYAIATGTGAVVGGWIVDMGRWQQMFLVSGGLAVAAIVMVLVLIPSSPGKRPEGPLDLVGGALFVVPITLLLLALTNGRNWGWSSPTILGLLAGGVLGLASWVRHELRTINPLIDVRLLLTPQIAMANLLVFLSMMGPGLYPQVMLPMIQQPVWTGIGLGVTAMLAGALKFPTNITSGISAVAVGYLGRSIGFRTPLIASSFGMLAAFLILIFNHDSLWVIMAVLIFLVAPLLNVVVPGAPALIIDAAPADRTSEATGVAQVLRSLGLSIGTQIVGVTLASSSITNAQGARFPDERAYIMILSYIAFITLLMVVTAFMLPARRPTA